MEIARVDARYHFILFSAFLKNVYHSPFVFFFISRERVTRIQFALVPRSVREYNFAKEIIDPRNEKRLPARTTCLSGIG